MTQIPVLILAETAMPTARSVIDQTVAHMSDECVCLCVFVSFCVRMCVWQRQKRQGKH